MVCSNVYLYLYTCNYFIPIYCINQFLVVFWTIYCLVCILFYLICISLSGRWILNILSIRTFRFLKILYQFLAYIIMYLHTICSRSSLLSTKNPISSQETAKQVTTCHGRYQFWPFSAHVEKFVGIVTGFHIHKKGLNIICTVKLHKVTTSTILHQRLFC